MKRRLLTQVLLVSSVSLAAAQEVYRVAYNEATAPLVPLVNAMYGEIGITPVFELVPSERAIAETSSGRYDADLSRVAGVEKLYPNLVRTEEPLKKTELYAYAKKGSGLVFKSVADLRQRTLGYTRGSKFVEEFLRDQGLQAYATNSADSLFKMLAAKRLDLVLLTSTQLVSQAQLIQQSGERATKYLSGFLR